MIRYRRQLAAAALLFGFGVVGRVPAGAATDQPISFAGKTIQLYIGFGPGGNYDNWARVIAKHLGKFLPGQPSVVAVNYAGAGSLRLINFMASAAPKDGTVIGLVSREATLSNLFGINNSQADSRSFGWLGTPSTEISTCIAYKGSPVSSVADLKEHTFSVGSTGSGNGTHLYPVALNKFLKLKFKVIDGYPSTSNVFLAMERHEVDGVCEAYDSIMARQPTWISSGTVKVLFQAGLEKEPALGDTPSILDLAPDAESRETLSLLYAGLAIGRPFLTPPGMPAAILKVERDAFDALMKDQTFLDDAKAAKLNPDPHDGAYLDKLFADLYATPRPIIDSVANLMH